MSISRRSLLKRLLAAGAGVAAAPAVGLARTEKGRPADAVGLLYDATKCIGCKACMHACREANGLEPAARDGKWDDATGLNAHAKNVITFYRGEAGRASFMKLQCMHCVDPACASVCMLGALRKGARGVVEYDADACVGCRYCQVACPFNVPRFEWSSATPRITKCELCRHRYAEGKGAACAEACPRDALRFGRRADLLAEARRRLAATPEAYYQKIYGERDGGGTGVLVLSAVPFETLGLPVLGKEPVPALGERIQHGIYQGFVAPVALFGALAFVTWRNRRTSEVEDDR